MYFSCNKQNENFIIAKQHPRDSSGVIDKSDTNYYIADIKNPISSSVDKNFYGPFTPKEFELKRRELNIQSIPFNILFEDLQ